MFSLDVKEAPRKILENIIDRIFCCDSLLLANFDKKWQNEAVFRPKNAAEISAVTKKFFSQHTFKKLNFQRKLFWGV